MIVQAVDDEGNAILESSTSCIRSKEDIFVLSMSKSSEAKVRFSFVLTGIETVIIVLAAHLSVWDIDYHQVNSACEVMTTRKHFTHLRSDVVEGSEEIPGPRSYSRMRLNGQGNLGYIVWNKKQEAYVLFLGFSGKERIWCSVQAHDSQAEQNACFVQKTRASPEISCRVKVTGKRCAKDWNLRDPLH